MTTFFASSLYSLWDLRAHKDKQFEVGAASLFFTGSASTLAIKFLKQMILCVEMKRKRNKHWLQHGRRHRQLSLMLASAAAPTFCQTARNISCLLFGFCKTCQRHPLSVQGGSPCMRVCVCACACIGKVACVSRSLEVFAWELSGGALTARCTHVAAAKRQLRATFC